MSTLISRGTDPRVESIVQSLCAWLGGRLDVETVAAEVEATFVEFAAARVTQFVPIFVERRVWERLSRTSPSEYSEEEEPRAPCASAGPGVGPLVIIGVVVVYLATLAIDGRLEASAEGSSDPPSPDLDTRRSQRATESE